MATLMLTFALFSIGFFGMAIGLIFQGRILQKSCGGGGDDGACACARKDAAVCPSDEELVRIAQIAHPNPKHHR